MTLDHEAMANVERWSYPECVPLVFGRKVSFRPMPSAALRSYRHNLLASASDPILNDAAMRTFNAFQPLARKVNHGRRR